MKADKEIANYLVDVDDSEEHYLSVKPADLVFPLIATVQQLKKEIEELKKQQFIKGGGKNRHPFIFLGKKLGSYYIFHQFTKYS